MIIAVVYLALIGLLGIGTAVAETTDRVSNTSQYSGGGRQKTQTPDKSVDNYGPLETEGARSKSPGLVASGKVGSSINSSKAGSPDFWFYSADIVLFGDDDADGYFFGIDLLFDVDTAWYDFDVYAVAYLSYEGGPWNEYAATNTFTLFGTSADDDFNIVTELESGYPAGSYDVLIEIFDAQTGDFLVGFGPEDSSELGFLPLEDFNRDAPIIRIPHNHSGGGGGGATGIWTILFLLLGTGLRSRCLWRR